jgi:glycosyltransferase involved in cell wall biosynthesis
VPERKLHVLGNGIDLRRFDPDEVDPDVPAKLRAEIGVGPNEVLVGAVGRLVREKGYLELFDAVRRARVEHPDLRLVVVGPSEPDKADGISAAEIEQAQRDGVIFLGHRDDVDHLYTAMDVYVLASHREGFPRSAMEAAAMGLPILATDIRGCRQVVDHGVTGLLATLGDVERLADGLRVLAGDAPRRDAMGRAAKVKARREFDQRNQIELTLSVYRERLAATSA